MSVALGGVALWYLNFPKGLNLSHFSFQLLFQAEDLCTSTQLWAVRNICSKLWLWHAAARALWSREVSPCLLRSKQHPILASPIDERNATSPLSVETLQEGLRNICWSTEKATGRGREQPLGKSEVRADTQEGWKSSQASCGVRTDQGTGSVLLSWLCSLVL